MEFERRTKINNIDCINSMKERERDFRPFKRGQIERRIRL